jgi:hypothetical protein
MKYPKLKPCESKESKTSGVYGDFDELIQLQFRFHGLFLKRTDPQGPTTILIFELCRWISKKDPRPAHLLVSHRGLSQGCGLTQCQTLTIE